ncbi:MAG: family 43 glycosylhydrolase [Oscillospiraceae bacterium]|nr:family 43 glycosylhydrolase [Oscillospiraceae bacterium]
MKKTLRNPYLPSWEYIPDGEPHLFDGRVYVYGSHDLFNGWVYCLNDYVCWSAPEDDLSDWRYEGVIYRKEQDPNNPGGEQCLYAPDVTRGPDGRYYLYYVLDHENIVSAAVCDTPAGEYSFYGFVHYPDGTLLGNRPGDDPQFDPAVLTEGDKTYLYTGGVCFPFEKEKGGAMGMLLDRDMLTVLEGPVFVVPSAKTSAGSDFEKHEFFEASSIRKFGELYYFVYSSVQMNELCYAVSREPLSGFRYGGVLVSNCDRGIGGWKDPDKRTNVGGNNHGGLLEAAGERYIFYHRHTNGTEFSRQGCMEKLTVLPDGSMPQVEMTSNCGGEPLPGRGEYPAYIACCLFREGLGHERRDPVMPRITQDGRDGDEESGYVAGITDGVTVGFKYFDCRGVKRVTVRTRGYAGGRFEVRTSLDGEALGEIALSFRNRWTSFGAPIEIADGVHPLYFTYRGPGSAMLASFGLE